MARTYPLAPVLKWAGGKRGLLGEILPFFPKRMACYCEPFVGGGGGNCCHRA
ncbi:MAG: DNA adenine methylase [Wolinella sp.]